MADPKDWQSDPDDDMDVVVGNGGTLSQEQFTSAIQKKVRQLRRKYEPQLQARDEELKQVKAELEKLQARAKLYNDHFTQTLAEKRKDLPDYVLKLLDAMPPEEQIAWLEENGSKIISGVAVERKTPPETPKPSGDHVAGKSRSAESDLVVQKSQTGGYHPF